MLVAAMNPCPCGYFGDLKRECRCSPIQVQRYRQRISGPLLDRIDLHIEVPAVEYRDMSSERTEETSSCDSRTCRCARSRSSVPDFKNLAKTTCNARMGPRQIKQHCKLDRRIAGTDSSRDDGIEPERARLRSHPESLAHHRRSRFKDEIAPEHVSEAIQYRTFDRRLWV